VLKFEYFFCFIIQLKEPVVKLTPRNTDATKCVQDFEKISAG